MGWIPELASGFISSVLVGSMLTLVPKLINGWVETGKPKKESTSDRVSKIEQQVENLRYDMAESFNDLKQTIKKV